MAGAGPSPFACEPRVPALGEFDFVPRASRESVPGADRVPGLVDLQLRSPISRGKLSC